MTRSELAERHRRENLCQCASCKVGRAAAVERLAMNPITAAEFERRAKIRSAARLKWMRQNDVFAYQMARGTGG